MAVTLVEQSSNPSTAKDSTQTQVTLNQEPFCSAYGFLGNPCKVWEYDASTHEQLCNPRHQPTYYTRAGINISMDLYVCIQNKTEGDTLTAKVFSKMKHHKVDLHMDRHLGLVGCRAACRGRCHRCGTQRSAARKLGCPAGSCTEAAPRSAGSQQGTARGWLAMSMSGWPRHRLSHTSTPLPHDQTHLQGRSSNATEGHCYLKGQGELARPIQALSDT